VLNFDLTDVEGESRDLGSRIKATAKQATSLTCSIAIAPNKLLAKIGSELDKPDGLTIPRWQILNRASGRWRQKRSTGLARAQTNDWPASES
jgi:nucleotidyltransferase/DNA polymerase involved in DNA repair